ncbi:MFS transporter [Nocardia sp. NPDC050630]|uniref:MFS transporter n=1 Tax=Nocardia sp. NPDC050630 TaxID=3364321 RepID=UPI00379EBC37
MPSYRSIHRDGSSEPEAEPAHLGTRSAATLQPPAADRKRWLILAVVLCASVMNQLDATVTIVAAPSVRASIGGGAAMMQWLATGYTLSYAVLLIPGGRLGDIYGRRRMFLVGLAGFTAASLACGFASTATELITFRVIQGMFAALLIPQGLGIIKAVFPPRELGTAFAAFAPIMGLASVSGPIIAGALIDVDLWETGWRSVFLINLPIGILALIGAVVLLPRKESLHKIRLDLIGVALMSVAAVLIIVPLVQGRALGWPRWTWLMLVAGVLLFGLFAFYERITDRAPIIEPSLLRNRTYVGGLAVVVVFFGAVSSQSLILSLYTQTYLHFTPILAAASGVPLSIGIAAAGVLANKLTARFGRGGIHAGLLMMTIGLGALAATIYHLGSTATIWAMIPPNAIIGVAMGLVFGPLFRAILASVNDKEVGSASGTLTATQQFGGTLGLAAITTIYFTLASNPADAVSGTVITVAIIAAIVVAALALALLLPAQQRNDR